MDGILNINKPSGKTSYAIVALVKRLTGEKRVGHAGTLDPLASGVLPVCLGQATRLVEYLLPATKTYLAEIELGVTTDTFDMEGQVLARRDYSAVTLAQIVAVLPGFCGQIAQKPPVYSALKQKGQPLYKLARAGVSVEVKSRPVRIESITIKDWHAPVLTVEEVCGKGAYIRSLAHDIGATLGCGGALRNLTRTRVGIFHYAGALTPEQLQQACAAGYWESLLYPMDSIIEDWQTAVVSGEMAKNIINGVPVALPADADAGHVRVYGTDGFLLAVMRYNAEKQLWQPEKVFRSLTPPDLCGTNNSRACCGGCEDKCPQALGAGN